MSSLLGTTLTAAQAAQIAANVSASKQAGVPALGSGDQTMTLPELFILPYLGEVGLQIYESAAEAAIGNIGANRALTDMQTFAKVAASDTNIVFDCTTSSSMYYPRNMCYDQATGLPRTPEQLFPTLSVELVARGQPLIVSLAPTVLGEGLSRLSASNTYTGTTSAKKLSKGAIAGIVIAVIVIVLLLAIGGWKAYKHVKSPVVPSGAAAWGVPEIGDSAPSSGPVTDVADTDEFASMYDSGDSDGSE